jgi:hypothetical protein
VTDVQILIPFATFVGTLAVVVVGFLYNNSRITDLRTDMNNRFGDFEKLLDAKLARLEEMMLHKFAELDDRFVRIENRLDLRL